MKIINVNATILCLTAISIIGLICGYPDVLAIWLLYGIYKVITND